jgi:hypothetical protein
MAVHAAALAGHDVVCVSLKRKSPLYGCQYLHQPIPEISSVDGVSVKYDLYGTVEQYRQKVYGVDFQGEVSPEDLVGDHFAWDIREAYDQLWSIYSGYIIDANARDERVKDWAHGADYVFSSIPAPVLCSNETHIFKSETVWAIGDAPELGIKSPVNVASFHVLCNGEEYPGWYRAANVFGYSTVEYPERLKPPFEGVAKVTKPISTNCDCKPKIRRLGRFGKWQKGVLSHTAFSEVTETVGAEQMSLW